MKFDKLTKIFVFGAVVFILIVGVLVWRFSPNIRNFFGRAEEPTIDLAWGGSNLQGGQGSLTFTCNVDANNVSHIDSLATLTNSGPDTATNVTVQFHGFLFDKSNPTVGIPGIPSWLNIDTGSVGSLSGDTWTLGGLAVNQSAALRITGTLPQDKMFNLTVEVASADPHDIDSTPGNWQTADEDDTFGGSCGDITVPPPPPPPPPSPATPEADLSLTKVVDHASIEVNSNATFTIEVHNSGPDATTNVTVKDVLPGGLSFVSASASRGTYAQANGIWTIGNMAVNDTVSLTLLVKATSAGTFTNTAEVASSDVHDPDSTPNNNIATEDDQASATVTATNPPPPPPGEVVCAPSTQTIQANHDAAFTATGGTGTFSWSAPGGTPNSGSGASFASKYAAAGTKTVTVTSGTSQYTCAVLVVAPPSTPEADLSLTKTAGNPTPQLNSNFTYSIVLSNAGPDGATNVIVKDVLPAGVSFITAVPTQGTYDNATGVWAIGSVAKDATAGIILTVKATEVGTITNTAEVTASDQHDPDSTPNNHVASEDDQASATVIVSNPGGGTPVEADLSLTKVVSNATPVVNQPVTYIVTVANSGPNNATGVVVNDLLPAGVTYTSHTVAAGTYDSTTGVWTIGALDKDKTVTLEIVVQVTQVGTIVNTAEVTASDQHDPDSTPNNHVASEDDQASVSLTSTATVPPCTSNCGGGGGGSPPASADLSLTKVVSNSTPSLGQTIIYRVTVFNSGPDTATGVIVADLLPAGATYFSHTTTQGTYVPATGVWTVGTLANGANAKLVITAVANTLGATINTAEVTASDQHDLDSTPNNHVATEDDQASVTINVGSPGGSPPPTSADLSLTKTVSESNPVVGQHITYSITVINSGPATATGVSVRDVIPAQLKYASFTTTQGSYDSASGIWFVGIIAPGNSVTLQLSVIVKVHDNIPNTAEVYTSDQPDQDSTPNNNNPNEDDQATVIIQSRPARILPAAGTSSAVPVALGVLAILAGAVVRFRFRSSRRLKVRAGGVIVQSYQRYE